MIPTLLGIMLVNFAIIHLAPGGPIERVIAELKGEAAGALSRVSGSGGDVIDSGGGSFGPEGGLSQVDAALIEQLEVEFGFDKPLWERFGMMMVRFVTFDFGDSYFTDRSITSMVLERLPVSISLGLWTTLITYLVSIPLGIRKAVRDGSPFDVWSSSVVIAGYAIPAFLLAVFLIVLFAGGRYLDWFPLRGLVSGDWGGLSLWGKVVDYVWHMTLPLCAMVVGSFATLTMLTKNSFLEEIHKQYVLTARAKGLTERRVLYGHVFRNAMLVVIAGFPGAFVGILLTSSLLIEVIFSLEGLGLLGFEAAINRDYPVMFASVYVFTLLGLMMGLVTDLVYTMIDPRIDFERAAS